MKWVEKWNFDVNECVWGCFCTLQRVPCTDLRRVPDSESTSALVCHIWPSSARTRCCSFCRQCHKPSRITGGKWWKWWHQPCLLWLHQLNFLKFFRRTQWILGVHFNYRQSKTIKRSNFYTVIVALDETFWQSLRKRRSVTTCSFVKKAAVFCFVFFKPLPCNYFWWRNYV